MKVQHFSRFFLSLNNRHSGRRVRASFFSTKPSKSSPSPLFGSIFQRISPIRDPKISIVPVLDEWVKKGNPVTAEDLRSIVHKMRGFKRFRHALEISHWMTDRRYFELTAADVAVRLNLIYEIHGLKHAEKYFNHIAKQLKLSQSYSAIMNCYVKEKSVEKAVAIMQEMERLGFGTSFAYNILINLYVQTGQHEKIASLMEEMKQKGFAHNKYTFINRLNSYVVVSDILGMENILKSMEADPYISVGWNVYALAANGYIKVGLIDKALTLLKKIEEMTVGKHKLEVLEYLLTLYTSCGMKDDVHRVWNFYQARGRMMNSSYCCMIASLTKLGDIAGAEEIFNQWESTGTSYDFRVLNRLIAAYCKNGVLEKAEAVVTKAVEKAAESGRAPFASTWNILALGYLEHKQMVKVLEMTRESLVVSRHGWKASPVLVDSCLGYFEKHGDIEGVKEFVKLLRAVGPLTTDLYHRLLRMYISSSTPVSDVLDWMEVDGIVMDEETHKILGRSTLLYEHQI